MCLWVELIVQSPFALLPLQKLHSYYGLIRESYSPAELRFFNLYQQPYWIGLSQLWYLTFSKTPWPVISAGAPDSISVYIESDVPAFPTRGIKVGLLNTLANDFPQAVHFGLQSSLYAKASQIDRPLSRSHFKEQSGRLLPSFHTVRYRSACRIYLLGRNG